MASLLRFLLWSLRALVFVVLFGLALKNSEPMELRFYFGHLWQAPVAVVILAVFVLGMVIGLTAAFSFTRQGKRRETP